MERLSGLLLYQHKARGPYLPNDLRVIHCQIALVDGCQDKPSRQEPVPPVQLDGFLRFVCLIAGVALPKDPEKES